MSARSMKISRGSLAVGGNLEGTLKAAAGSISSTELASGVALANIGSLGLDSTSIAASAVTNAKVADGAISSPKLAFSWSTLKGSTGAATIGSSNGGFLITAGETTRGVVVTGGNLSAPTAGDFYVLYADAGLGSSSPVKFKSTSATFDGTNAVASLTANDQFVRIEAVSASRWVITARSTGVSFAGTT